MQITDIFSITLPIFLMIAIGYGAVRFGVMASADTRILGRYTLYIALPALVFHALSTRPIQDIVNVRFLGGHLLASLTVFGVSLFFARKILKLSHNESAAIAMGSSLSNSGFVGYPIAALAVGPIAVVTLALAMIVENAVLIPLSLALAGGGERAGGRLAVFADALRGLLRNPLFLAILAGLAVSLSAVTLPSPVARTVEMMALSALPVALFVVGGSLYGVRLIDNRVGLATVVVAKLIVLPLVVLLVFSAIPGMDPLMRTAIVISAGSPMMSIFPLLGARFGQDRFCAAALLAATLASFATISFWLAALDWLGMMPSTS